MTDPAEAISRNVAARLAGTSPRLPVDVELALGHRNTPSQRPSQYFDPISLAGLIISIASLAWTVYTDLKKQNPAPTPAALTQTIRVQYAAQHPDQPPPS